MNCNILYIFDYSGTLSMEAVYFATPENLMKTLTQSGLYRFGISSLDIFWNKIVNPTWETASLSSKGYTQAIVESTLKLLNRKLSRSEREELKKAAFLFVQNYLSNSRIDPAWQPLFQHLLEVPDSLIVIATDHYAEATTAFIKHFQSLNFNAASIMQAPDFLPEIKIYIANSADIGSHKKDPKFWLRVKSLLNLEDIKKAILIDDFGTNEQEMDTYGDKEKVVRREQETVDILKQVFHTTIISIPFILKKRIHPSHELNQEYRQLISRTSQTILQIIQENL